ncbi:MAG: acyl-homoserine-lactone synthase [Sneathiellaceae bacterium]
MIYVISGADVDQYSRLFDQVYALRHKVFVEEMGWEDLRSPDGKERDQFDDHHAVHHLCVRDNIVVGYQRMLPTTRPHLLSDIFPQLCVGTSPRGPGIYELTRYCVSAGHREGRRGVGSVGSELIAGLVEWGLQAGVHKAIIEFEPMWVLRAMQLQFLARPLGLQTRIGDQNIVATELTFNDHTLETIREFRGHDEPVLRCLGSLGKFHAFETEHALAS